ncbi:MAG: S-layer y domain protein [Firmicutes bacterium]|nr:S-layer y domain protein [Bacillota bacterium]
MKKPLILLVAFCILCSTSVAMAVADPFSDVPAKHWAYDAVAKLAEAGIISGYGDGTYRGDRIITRYEMAQIVGNAMTKEKMVNDEQKALIKKLAAEFADEISSLKMRVSGVESKTKSLEQKMPFTIHPDMWFIYSSDSASQKALEGSTQYGSQKLRYHTRIFLDGIINEKMSWHACYENSGDKQVGTTADFEWGNMYITMKNFLGIDQVDIGRTPIWGLGNGMFGRPGDADSVKVFKKLRASTAVTVFVGNIKTPPEQSGDLTGEANPTLTTAQIKTTPSDNFGISFGHYWSTVNSNYLNFNTGTFRQSNGYDVAFDYHFGGLMLLGECVSTNLVDKTGTIPSHPRGWALELTNSKMPPLFYPTMELVDHNKPSTDAWAILYHSVQPGTLPNGCGNWDTMSLTSTTPVNGVNTYFGTDNMNVLALIYQAVPVKNVIVTFRYLDQRLNDKSVTSMPEAALDKIYQVKVNYYF